MSQWNPLWTPADEILHEMQQEEKADIVCCPQEEVDRAGEGVSAVGAPSPDPEDRIGVLLAMQRQQNQVLTMMTEVLRKIAERLVK